MIVRNILVGASTTLAAAAVVWVFTVGGFVTHQAYAEDQNKLDQIIDILTYQQERKSLDDKITNAEQRMEEVQFYIDAAPESELKAARQNNHRRLKNLKIQYEREKESLDQMRAASR